MAKVTIDKRAPLYGLTKARITQLVRLVLEDFEVLTDEVVVHFVSKKEICALHEAFFKDPSPTDCISFPIDSPEKERSGYAILGELFVCTEVAKEVAQERACKPQDEIMLYLVHGLLHLLGYNDLTPKERQTMRRQEARLLRKAADQMYAAKKKKNPLK